MPEISPKARAITRRIVRDLRGRSALGDIWDTIDAEICNEIVYEWKRLVQEELDRDN